MVSENIGCSPEEIRKACLLPACEVSPGGYIHFILINGMTSMDFLEKAVGCNPDTIEGACGKVPEFTCAKRFEPKRLELEQLELGEMEPHEMTHEVALQMFCLFFQGDA